jgi:hypothetical protein
VRVALVTCAQYPLLTDDDRPLCAAFARYRAEAEPVQWNAPDINWCEFDRVVIRSCWDYHLRTAAFERWVQRLAVADANVWNPPELLRWNMDKRYLTTLAANGVAIPDTTWLRKGESVRLAQTLTSAGWSDAVVKPVVSAAAMDTWRIDSSNMEDMESAFGALLQRGDVMIQRFVAEILDQGEWSLVFIAGEFSHAVVKRPLNGDFRAQEQHGGSVAAATPSRDLLAQACRVAELLPPPWLYARIDGVVVNGEFLLLEAECIEPRLYFGTRTDAYDRFAAAACTPVRLSATL